MGVRRVFVALSAFLMYLLSCGGPEEPKISLPAELKPGSGYAEFYQLVWILSQAQSAQGLAMTQENRGVTSGTGYFVIDVGKLDVDGYVQVVTEKGWVVQNVPIFSNSTYSRLAVKFRLGDTAEYPPVNSIDAYVLVTPEPISRPPEKPAFKRWKVSLREYAIGGKEVPTTRVPDPPPVEEYNWEVGSQLLQKSKDWPYSDVFNVKVVDALETKRAPTRERNECIQKNPLRYNIQAAQNQCGPAATANSLHWLQDTFQGLVELPHKSGKGLGNVNGSKKHDGTTVGALDVYMKRNVKSRKEGDPLPDEDFLRGKLQYLADNKICLVVQHQDNNMTGDISAGGITSKGRGVPTWEFICKEICKGEDVEMGYTFPGGGHWVRVTGCGHIKGRRYLKFVSDTMQTDVDPDDEKGTGVVEFEWVGSAVEGVGFRLPGMSATVDIVVTESVPEIAGYNRKDICPWLRQTEPPKVPELRKRCEGADPLDREVWVCVEGDFDPQDELIVDYGQFGGGSVTVQEKTSCVCLPPAQTNFPDETVSYTVQLRKVAGALYVLSGQIYGGNARACSCQ